MKGMLAGLLLAGLVATAQATEIYQWKDEQGRVHFGETVPEKYKKSAQQKPMGELNIVPIEKVPPLPPAPATSPAPASAPEAAPTEPAPAVSERQRCQQEIQRYRQSQECFAPYRNANGSVSPEAFELCEQLPQPTCAGNNVNL